MGGGLAAIPLQGRPVQVPDSTEQLGRMVQLADLINTSRQRQAMLPYQQEEAESMAEMRRLQAQEIKRQQADRDALTEALKEVKGNFFAPEFKEIASKRGVSGQTMLALQKEIDDAVASHSKRDLNELELERAKNAEIADVFMGMTDINSRTAGIDKLVKAGYLSPEEAASVNQGPFDPDKLKQAAILHGGANYLLERAIKEQQLKAAQAAEKSALASARKTGVEAEIGESTLNLIKNAKPEDYEALVDKIVPPDVAANKRLNEATKAQIRQALKQPDGIKVAQELLQSASIQMRQLEVATDPRVNANKIYLATETAKSKATGGGLIPQDYDPGKQYTIDDVPSAIRPMVENALKYQSALPPQSRLNPSAQGIRWWTMAIDPHYSEELFPARKAAVLSISSGKTKDKLSAMSTALGHVGRLEEAVDALKNNDIRALNAIANEIGAQTGNSAPIVFNTIVHRIGPELTQAYVGSGGEASERAQAGGDFDVNQAPDTIRAAARITAKLLSSKMGSELFYFRQAARFAPDDPRAADLVTQFFTPEAISVMDRMFPGWKTGVEPGTPTAQGGKPAETATKNYVGKVYYSKDGKTRVQYTSDGKLWNLDTGAELDPATGKEK